MFEAILCSENSSKQSLYVLDSNVYLDLARYFYTGHFKDNVEKEQALSWLIQARRDGQFTYEHAAIETSFDYGTNSINVKAQGQLFFAVDTLVTEMNDTEMKAGIARNKIHNDIQRDNTDNLKTIFDCNLPMFLFDNEKGMLPIFYFPYLYCLKIQSLYRDNTLGPMEKVKKLYQYMLDDIGIIFHIEFQLGKMLFIGDQESESIARKLLKPEKQASVRQVTNSIVDIALYRLCKHMADVPGRTAYSIYFVTSDKALQKLFSISESLVTGINISELHTDNTDVKRKHLGEWQDFYSKEILPTTELRFNTPFLVDENRGIIQRNMEHGIRQLELELFKS